MTSPHDPQVSFNDFRAVIDVHLRGSWLGTRAAGDSRRAALFLTSVRSSYLTGGVLEVTGGRYV